MNYSVNKFIKPLAETDRNVQIWNNANIIKFTVNPFSVSRTNVHNNLVHINLKYNKVIALDFSTSTEAREALEKLQFQLDILRERVPYSIDKQVENYIENNIEPDTIMLNINNNIYVEDIWVESDLIPTDEISASASSLVEYREKLSSYIPNTYSFEVPYDIGDDDLYITPDNYGTFYEPKLYSSVDDQPISATGTPSWKLVSNKDCTKVTFYGGFPNTPIVGPSNPPVLKYYKYTGRLGTFNFVGGKTNIIETTGTSNIVTLPTGIRENNIISVTINGVDIYRWSYSGNDLVIDEVSLDYTVDPLDLIRIETNMSPGGLFTVI